MKKAIIAAAAAAALWGGAALAQDDASGDQAQVQTEGQTTVRTPSTSQTTQDTWRNRTVPDENTGVGGSGPATVQTAPSAPAGQQQMLCNCREFAPGTGGSGLSADQAQQGDHEMQCTCRPPAQGTGGAGYYGAPAYNPGYQQQGDQEKNEQDQGVDEESHEQSRQDLRDQGTGGSGDDTVVVKEGDENEGPDLKGVTVLLGGGVEGYTGALAPRVNVGPTYGAALQFRPTDILGMEVAYSGGLHELKSDVTHGADVASGADIVRNGARAMATIGLLDSPIQPYILGGVGVNWYNARGNAKAFGFKDDTSGEVPLGLGLRTQFGAFTADLRGLYNVPFSQDFAPGVTTTTTNAQVVSFKTENDGRYQGTLSIGANF